MNTFNGVVFLWQLSFLTSIIAFVFGIMKMSWISMIISFFTFLLIAYYFFGANNGWRLVFLLYLHSCLSALLSYGKNNQLRHQICRAEINQTTMWFTTVHFLNGGILEFFNSVSRLVIMSSFSDYFIREIPK
ncbi:hypothetical protein CU633_21380 [Bacillus sp. V3-13]|nr:hypothetical protein CU633_21380 [Bacillus sp. V3-13]